MSIWDEAPTTPVGLTFAGGVATDAELYDASRNAMMWVDNVNATELAREEAYDRRNDEIFKATGQRLDNPQRLAAAAAAGPEQYKRYKESLSDWYKVTGKLQETRPDLANVIKAHVPIETDAKELARAADEKLGVLSASRDDRFGAFVPQVAGGFAGSLRDPVQVGALLVGGGVGAGRTAFARIASTAMREALVNGAVEAAMQPAVQNWRAEIGVESGFDVAARNVLFAAGTAGVIGGAGRAVREGVTRLAARAVEGDADAALASLAPHRDNLPDELRGGIDHMETEMAVTRMERPGVPADVREPVLARAIAAAEDPAQMAKLADAEPPPSGPVVRAMAADAPPSIHGPLMPKESYGGDWATLVARMQEQKAGDAPGALFHKDVGEIDVMWGEAGTGRSDGFGLAKLVKHHAAVVARLPEIIAEMNVTQRTAQRVQLESADHKAAVRLSYDGQAKTWLLTAFGKPEDLQPVTGRTVRRDARGVDSSSARLRDEVIAPEGGKVEAGGKAMPAPQNRAATAPDGSGQATGPKPETRDGGANAGQETAPSETLVADLPEGARVVRDDGTTVDVRDAMAEAGRDEDLAMLIEACKLNG